MPDVIFQKKCLDSAAKKLKLVFLSLILGCATRNFEGSGPIHENGHEKIKVPPAHRAAPTSVPSSPRPHVCKCSESYSGGPSPLVAPRV